MLVFGSSLPYSWIFYFLAHIKFSNKKIIDKNEKRSRRRYKYASPGC